MRTVPVPPEEWGLSEEGFEIPVKSEAVLPKDPIPPLHRRVSVYRERPLHKEQVNAIGGPL